MVGRGISIKVLFIKFEENIDIEILYKNTKYNVIQNDPE